MAIPNQLPNTEVVLLEVEILLTLISVGAWGGFVSYFIGKEKTQQSDAHKSVMNCVKQVVISCFTSFLLSALAIEKGFSFNMVLLAAGLGGVFAAPILKILGDKIKKHINDVSSGE